MKKIANVFPNFGLEKKTFEEFGFNKANLATLPTALSDALQQSISMYSPFAINELVKL